ncbi:MAG: rhodanese-like domain-containing protein [Candidatus Nanopelagicales bacterium]
MEPVVSVDWLADHLEDDGLRVYDATIHADRVLGLPRIRNGRREYRRAHVPGSGFADLLAIHGPARRKWTMPVPTAEHFEHVIGAMGVSNDSRVVLYDRRDSMWAARLWWLLRAFGHDSGAVLDGGWRAWQAAGHPVCGKPCGYPPARFTAHPRSGLLVGKAEVIAAIDDPHVVLVNALGRRQHRGEVNEYGRRGHIPGSLNVTAWEILDRNTGCYRPLDQLREKAQAVLSADRVITYCGSGAAAASLANVLVRLGHPDVAVYDGGLVEWCADRSLPLERGP